MESEILEKIKKLSPELRTKLEDETFLIKVDDLSGRYGVKGILIFLRLLLGELAYGDLADYLIKEYGFNDFLAKEIKIAFGKLIEALGEMSPPAVAEAKPASQEKPKTLAGTKPQAVFPASKPNSIAIDSAKADSSAMTFSREDEEEIKKIKSVSSDVSAVDYQSVAQTIASSLNLSGLDEILSNRLLNIIISRLKDVRDELETKEMLMKGKKVGGLEQSEEQAETIVKVIRNFNTVGVKLSQSGRFNLPPSTIQPNSAPFEIDEEDWEEEETNTALPALNPEHELMVVEDEDGLPTISIPKSAGDSSAKSVDFSTPTIAKKEKKDFYNQEKLSKEAQNVKMKPKAETVERSAVSQSAESRSIGKVLPPARPIPFMAEKKIPESVLNSRSSQRPNLDGVKFEKKLAGPIDELGNMTLIDFRRLAADPKIAVNKIKEKIDLLETDGLTKRLEGISAWQQSEANKFYRLLGQSSMSDGRPVEDVIKERLFAGKPTLSIDEFYAIMELNRQLRF